MRLFLASQSARSAKLIAKNKLLALGWHSPSPLLYVRKVNKNMNIMEMESGTKIKNKRSGVIFVLGDYVNDVAREIYNTKYCGAVDYINANTQGEYEVV